MSQDLSRRELLDAFGVITEEDLAQLLGLNVRTLRNRPHTELPPFVRPRRGVRLFKKADVAAWMERQHG
jgi:hypothetical protein